MCRMRGGITPIAAGIMLVQAASAMPVLAEPWPQRPVRVIVQVSGGNVVDIMARFYAERLAERWKQPVYVENRPGADGLIGTVAFAGTHDAHTLMFSPAAPISVYPYIYEKLGYDPVHDLVPVARAAETFVGISAAASLNIGSLEELVAMARARPGKLNYNTAAGAFPTLFAGFLKSTGLDMVHISYRETNLALQDMATGRLDIELGTLGTVLPAAESGRARVLAVTNRIRAPLAPEVPTAIEAGYPELTFEGLLGFFGPHGLSVEIRDRIAIDVCAVAADPAFAKHLVALAAAARCGTPAEFSAAIEEQRAKIASPDRLLDTRAAEGRIRVADRLVRHRCPRTNATDTAISLQRARGARVELIVDQVSVAAMQVPVFRSGDRW
jgi:tripartite-type tricarboxylate transporter receptor subunit TctC